MTAAKKRARADLAALLLVLKQARARRSDLTQARLAEVLGLADNSVQDWELNRDSPTLPHLILWAHELGYRLDADSHHSTIPQTHPRTPESAPYEVREFRRLSSILRVARCDNWILQQDLAERLDVSRYTVIRWERARNPPRPVKFLMWAHAVGSCQVK